MDEHQYRRVLYIYIAYSLYICDAKQFLKWYTNTYYANTNFYVRCD